MSLRYQIAVRFFFISIFILLLGGTLALWQARGAVQQEVDASLNLAVPLIRLSMPKMTSSSIDENAWMQRLSSMEQVRHLSITLKKPNGEFIELTRGSLYEEQEERPPQWFIDLVKTDYPEIKQQITTQNNRPFTLIMQADPLDEISEIWDETVVFFLSICALIFLTFLAIHLVFNKTLKAIHVIVANLKLVETGEYQTKLPEFGTLEYDSIVRAINHMTDVLAETQQKNSLLTQHSLQIQEEERQKLSQELHDEFGQSLTAIKVMAVTAEHENADTPQITRSITQVCDHLMGVVRSMMQQLHPLILTELGLKATLEDLVNRWQKRSPDIIFELRCDDSVDELSHVARIQVMRVIQEGLTNVMRHSDASKVEINLHSNISPTPHIDLQLTDNGQGCDMENMTGGYGLSGMRERLSSLGGKLRCESQPGLGMKISACIPIQ